MLLNAIEMMFSSCVFGHFYFSTDDVHVHAIRTPSPTPIPLSFSPSLFWITPSLLAFYPLLFPFLLLISYVFNFISHSSLPSPPLFSLPSTLSLPPILLLHSLPHSLLPTGSPHSLMKSKVSINTLLGSSVKHLMLCLAPLLRILEATPLPPCTPYTDLISLLAPVIIFLTSYLNLANFLFFLCNLP